jgi:peptidyl-tRNA hydrolase
MARKLYLVTRSDLPFEQQAVQAAHSLHSFEKEHREVYVTWRDESQTLAFLAAPNEGALQRLLEKAEWAGVPAAGFLEPDLGNSLTAVAVGPAGKKLCRRFPLAISGV